LTLTTINRGVEERSNMRMKFEDASVNDREGDITQSMIKKIENPLCKEEWENPRLKNYHRHEPITIGCKP